jgi:DNA replication protein DnaC
VGYLRSDLPLGHPDFGKLEICSCRQGQISQQVRQRLFALSNLDELQHLTFESFKPRGHVGMRPTQADSLERAYNQARQYARALNGWLLLEGGYGCGKTHLAAAIANDVVSLGVPTLFITVPDLLDSLRFSYNSTESTFEERFETIRNAGLLILDDFGTQNATPWAQEKLFQIINYRYINHLPLIVTTNMELEEMEGRIRSRLEDPELVSHVHIMAPDYRRPTEETGQSELSSLSRYSHQTFTTWEDRRSEGVPADEARTLEEALRGSMDYARNPEGWLLLFGPNFCGKTHLAAAIANYRLELGDRPLLVSVIDLLDFLRATFSPNSTARYDRRFDEIKTAPLLILDGLGLQSMTPWSREKLFQLFDYRYTAKLPTVITMTGKLEDLENSDPAIASRLFDKRLTTIKVIKAPPYRGMPVNKARRRGKGAH